MISGYFLISSKKMEIDKFIKLLIQIIFYSMLFFLIFVGLGLEKFNLVELIKHLLGTPIYWFAENYLILYLIHPYLNKLLNNLDKKESQKLIIILTLLLNIIPNIRENIIKEPINFSIILWFIYIYLIGGYLKKYPLKIKLKPKKYILISLTLYLITFLSFVIVTVTKGRIELVATYEMYFFGIANLSTLIITLFLFLGFSNLKIKYNKIINIISTTTFGIYLIHDNDYVRNFIWQVLFKCNKFENTYILIPYSLIVIIVVFIICMIIELLRIYILEKKYQTKLSKIPNIISNIWN